MTNFPDLPETIQWKPGAVSKDGTKALALGYADSRDVFDVLDAAGVEWHTEVVNVIADGKNVHTTVKLEIDGIVRTDVGTDSDAPSAFAQGLKRAAAQHGIFRGLYRLPKQWADYSNQRKCFTDSGLDALRRSLDPRVGQPTSDRQTPASAGATKPRIDASANGDGQDIAKLRRQFHTIGTKLYNERWEDVRHKNIARLTDGRTEHTNDLDASELQTLIAGMQQLQRNGVPA